MKIISENTTKSKNSKLNSCKDAKNMEKVTFLKSPKAEEPSMWLGKD